MNELERKQAEMDFHDQRERDRKAMDEDEFLQHYPNKRFYTVASLHREFLHDFIANNAPGSKALDYCCGLGETSLQLLKAGAHCTGIDISPESVETARERAKDAGFDEASSHFEVMDAEHMTFEDDSFDLIVCSGVLHHLDINLAYPELARVLRPGGKVIALEALGHNPLIQLYRKMTPKLRTEWEADHIITRNELSLAGEYFGGVTANFFYLTSIVPIVLAGKFESKLLLSLTNGLDKWLQKTPLKFLSWQVVYVMTAPRSA